ncbi:hypothetical protein CPLU01_03199 [Colletotrichum plurivorum]|uniref:Uncharacterized protein n=1 Tax=Colletotrichum plurivorum TaxID=2175906 RepID=A0A8H6NLT4_9PEZI|nr:hypothetical protein CPLU01_03199 [Colletotrichum plurivorum]
MAIVGLPITINTITTTTTTTTNFWLPMQAPPGDHKSQDSAAGTDCLGLSSEMVGLGARGANPMKVLPAFLPQLR